MKINNDKGQATIEFIFSFAIGLLFILFFIFYCINLGAGYLAHYATYSTSRAYLTYDYGGNNPRTNFQRSKEYALGYYIGNFSKPLKAIGLKVQNNEPQFNSIETNSLYDYTGVYLRFLPPFQIGSDDTDSYETNSYVSESFLGKEPSRAECGCQVLNAMGIQSCSGGGYPSNLRDDITVFDNGC